MFFEATKALQIEYEKIVVIVVGLDSCLDIVAKVLPADFEVLREIDPRTYHEALRHVSTRTGGEVPVEFKVIDEVLSFLREKGRTIFYNLGGNGAIQVSALYSITGGKIPIGFVGIWFKRVVEILKKENYNSVAPFLHVEKLLPADERNMPVSLVMDYGPERFILSYGSGRRTPLKPGYSDEEGVLTIIPELPRVTAGAKIVSNAGWQAIMAELLLHKKERTLNEFFSALDETYSKIAKNRMLIIDVGSLLPYSLEHRKKLFANLYTYSKILALNETELIELTEIFEAKGHEIATTKIPSAVAKRAITILDNAKETETLWIHSADVSYVVTTADYDFELPLRWAAAAGVIRVETGWYPTYEECSLRAGEVKIDVEIAGEYRVFVSRNPRAKKAISTVGAGDTATAGFIYGLCKNFKGE